MSAKTKCAESYRLNDRVFAKMKSYPIWPAKIIEILDNDKYKVFFYGTHDCAVVPLSNVTKYEKLKNNIPKSKLKSYSSAVKEIKQDVNNKLFSCEKIKKYQKNYATKNKCGSINNKNESEERTNKKRKIVTNTSSEKGAPSKKPKKNQKSVDFSIFAASELWLECSTPENVPVRMHISDVLTKDILSTLPDYDKDPAKWKTFVLCVVDFIRCKIIKGEPVPHEVQNNIDVIIQNNRSHMNISPNDKSSKKIEATSTCPDTKDNIKVNLRKRSQSSELVTSSNFPLEILPDRIKKEIEENEIQKEMDENYGQKEIEENDPTCMDEEEKERDESQLQKEIDENDDPTDINKEEKERDESQLEKEIDENDDPTDMDKEEKERDESQLEKEIDENDDPTDMDEVQKETDESQLEKEIDENDDPTNMDEEEKERDESELQKEIGENDDPTDMDEVQKERDESQPEKEIDENDGEKEIVEDEVENKEEEESVVETKDQEETESDEKKDLKQTTDCDSESITNMEQLVTNEEPNTGVQNTDTPESSKPTDAKEMPEVPAKPAESSNSNEIIQRESPLFKNEKLLAKYMNYFNKRKLKLDLTEINNHIAKVLESKQENKAEQVQKNHQDSQSECEKGHDTDIQPCREDVPKKTVGVTSDAIQTNQADDSNNNTLSDLKEKNDEIPKTSFPKQNLETGKVCSNLANVNSTDNPSCSDDKGSTVSDHSVHVNTHLSQPTDTIHSDVAGNKLNGGQTLTMRDNGTKHISSNQHTPDVHSDCKENSFSGDTVESTNQLCRDTIEALLKTNMSFDRQSVSKGVQEYRGAYGGTNFSTLANDGTSSGRNHAENFESPMDTTHFDPTGNVGGSSHTTNILDVSSLPGVETSLEDNSNPSQANDLSESQLNDLVHELFQQECQALSLHVRLMQCLNFNKNQQRVCSEADLLSAGQLLSDLYHMKLNQFVLLRNPQLVFTCRLIAKCSRDFVDKNNNTNPPNGTGDSSNTHSPRDRKSEGHHSDTLAHCHFHARTLETTAIRFLQYVSRVFDFKSGENFYDQFNSALAKFHKETKNMTWSDMIYLAEQCIRNNIW